MKLSFSTRGWQHLSWEELITAAEESGMNGIELYDLFKRGDLIDRGCPFDRYRAATTVRQLREKGLVELINPEMPRGRLYRLTDDGKRILNEIKGGKK